jgi:hypothetical protein
VQAFAGGDLSVGVREAEEKRIGVVVQEPDPAVGVEFGGESRRALCAPVVLEQERATTVWTGEPSEPVGQAGSAEESAAALLAYPLVEPVLIIGSACVPKAREEAVRSDEVRELEAPGEPLDTFLAPLKIAEFDSSVRGEDPRTEVVEDVVVGRRAGLRWRLEAIDDLEPVQTEHPSASHGSGFEEHLRDLVDREDSMLIEKVHDLDVSRRDADCKRK